MVGFVSEMNVMAFLRRVEYTTTGKATAVPSLTWAHVVSGTSMEEHAAEAVMTLVATQPVEEVKVTVALPALTYVTLTVEDGPAVLRVTAPEFTAQVPESETPPTAALSVMVRRCEQRKPPPEMAGVGLMETLTGADGHEPASAVKTTTAMPAETPVRKPALLMPP